MIHFEILLLLVICINANARQRKTKTELDTRLKACPSHTRSTWWSQRTSEQWLGCGTED